MPPTISITTFNLFQLIFQLVMLGFMVGALILLAKLWIRTMSSMKVSDKVQLNRITDILDQMAIDKGEALIISDEAVVERKANHATVLKSIKFQNKTIAKLKIRVELLEHPEDHPENDAYKCEDATEESNAA